MVTRCVQVTELVGLSSRCRTIRVGLISAFLSHLSKDDGHPLGHPSGSLLLLPSLTDKLRSYFELNGLTLA